MSSVFISYSWKDQNIVKDVIIPLLRDHGIDYYIDYEHFEIDTDAEYPVQQDLARKYLTELSKSTAFKPWQESEIKGKPIPELPGILENEIANRDVLLVLMSQFASASFWVNREVDFSISFCHKILVVCLDNVILPDRLMTLVNSGQIPCVRFTGEEEMPIPLTIDDYIQGFFSTDEEKKRCTSILDMNVRHGVSYRKPTEQDKARLIAELNSLSESLPFGAYICVYGDGSAFPGMPCVYVREDEFTLSNVPFQFVTITGSPYFSRVSMLKYPVTVQQFALYDPEVVNSEIFTQQDTLLKPITNVTWDEATAFCKWLSRQTSHNIRLPYEVEWEFACRAGSKTMYCFGDDEFFLSEYAWYKGERLDPHIVGRKKPNRWGLYDMHGNVYEWCADILNVAELYSILSPKTYGKIRVYRGGCVLAAPSECRSGARYFDTRDSSDYRLGFRLFWRRTRRQEEKSHE